MELVNFPLTHGTWATPEVWAERNALGGTLQEEGLAPEVSRRFQLPGS